MSMSVLNDIDKSTAERVCNYMLRLNLGALNEIEQRDSWKSLQMSAAAHAILQRHMDSYRPHSLSPPNMYNYDYDPTTSVCTIRNPGSTHQSFCDSLYHSFATQTEALRRKTDQTYLLLSKLKAVPQKSYGKIVEFQTVPVSSFANSTHDPEPILRQPDMQYFYDKRQYPTVVIEVACDQKLKDLQSLAESYIVDSHHEIKCVIGIDISPCIQPTTTPAFISDHCSITMWGPATERDEETGVNVGVCVKVLDAVPFRTRGRALEGSLSIPLHTFLPDAVRRNLPQDYLGKNIEVSFSDLSRFLDQAMAEEPTNRDPLTPKPTIWRKRRRSFADDNVVATAADSRRRTREANGTRARASARLRTSAPVKQEPASSA